MFAGIARVATILSLATAASAGFAQEYPNKPVAMVMPFSAGGPGDNLARVLGQSMTKSLGQTVIIENTAGAGGTIGTAKVAKARPDGYTLLFTHISHATNPTLYRKLPYDTLKDFEPIGLVADVPMTLVAKKDLAPSTFKELLAYLQANKDKVAYSHAGTGSASHLCGLLLQTAIQTNVTTVGYKGTGPAMNDLLGGQVDLMCDQTANTLQHIKAAKLKVYGVTSPKRIAQLPDVPTLQEAGLPRFELSIWYGLYAPKGTPKPVVDKLVAALQAAIADDNLKSRFAQLGAVPVAADQARPGPLATQVKAEIDKWAPIIKQAGVYAD
jgi:tripartite-type tricarboxylate transporter receptor subunit TctC